MSNLVGGYALLAVFWGFSWISIKILSERKVTLDTFLVSRRNVGLLLGGVTTAVSWVWAGALFVSSQKAYEQGLPGLFWFTLPNASALILFSFLATRMRRIFPEGFTLPEFIGKRFDRKMQILYVFTIFIVQCYAVIFNLTAALLMLNLVTGIPKPVLVTILGSMMISLAILKGIQSSLAEDRIKAFFIAIVVVVIVPIVIFANGGLTALVAGSGGTKGIFTSVLDPGVAWAFGVPISVSLLSGIVIDQQQWQRAFSMKEGVSRGAFILGGFIFAGVPIMLGMLGFLAATKDLQSVVTQPQLAGFNVAAATLSQVGVIAFSAMVLAGLVAAGSSALAAISSIGAVDVYKFVRPDATDRSILIASRCAMFILIFVGMSVALIPAIQLLYLILLVGVLRSSLLVPTVLSLFWSRLSSKFIFGGILTGIVVGVPLFVYGSLSKDATISSIGALIPISVTTIAALLSGFANKRPFDFKLLSK